MAEKMKICLITDSWYPLVNGVATTLTNVVDILKQQTHEVLVINPNLFSTTPCPTYPEIQLAKNPWKIKEYLEQFDPQAIHIATEGPLGFFGRLWCLKNKKPFTTSYHTKFPEYVKARFNIPLSITYWWLRKFHSKSNGTLVTTKSMKSELSELGFKNLTVWTRGVDQELFNPQRRNRNDSDNVYLYVGRISIEKNISVFLDLDLSGRKIVVGDGPLLDEFKNKYPDVDFVGVKKGKQLAEYYANADVFVFPSKTDTFGVVNIEALASGTPVAAYPVTGPKDIIIPQQNGFLHDNLEIAINECLKIDSTKCRESVQNYTWTKCAEMFFDHLKPVSK